MEEPITIDFEEELSYIASKTGLDKDTIEKIFDADAEFLKSKGVIE